jgi:tRNA(Ile)-lysidine synthase
VEALPRRSDALTRGLAAFAGRHGLFGAGARIGVAVSGGADSVALLLLLDGLAAASGWQLTVLHYDHAWRAESGADAAFVAALARRLGWPLRGARARAPLPMADREQQARRARYAFFERAGAELDWVATAHTADDQAETVLLRLLRGAGPAGLAGILPRRALAPGSRVRLARPLLWARREALRAWLGRREQPWREDRTNQDLHPRRNRVRHEFLPPLAAAFNPGLVRGLCDLAEILRAEEEVWAAALAGTFARLWQPGRGGGGFRRDAFARLPLALRRRLVREAVGRVQGDLLRVDFRAVQEVVDWAACSSRHPRVRRLGRVECRVSAQAIEFALALKL